MQIRIQRTHPQATLPRYAHGPNEDAGMDLHAVEDVVLEPGAPRLVPTGLTIEVPPGYEAQVRPRSGLALKHAITIPNAPGTIDPGYRGELPIFLLNLGREPYTVHAGDRIAQMILARYETVEWLEGDLADSSRGAGGFGASGREVWREPTAQARCPLTYDALWQAGGGGVRSGDRRHPRVRVQLRRDLRQDCLGENPR